MKGLNTLSSYCPHFCRSIGTILCDVEPKCKKQDIVSTIVFFEGQSENTEIVNRRHNMWAYMTELATDPKMRMYLLWS